MGRSCASPSAGTAWASWRRRRAGARGSISRSRRRRGSTCGASSCSSTARDAASRSTCRRRRRCSATRAASISGSSATPTWWSWCAATRSDRSCRATLAPVAADGAGDHQPHLPRPRRRRALDRPERARQGLRRQVALASGRAQLRRQNEPPPIAVQLPDGAHCDAIVQRSGAQKRTLGASAGVTSKPSPPTWFAASQSSSGSPLHKKAASQRRRHASTGPLGGAL